MEEVKINPESLKKRNILLIAGTIGFLFAGILYAWSILKVPLGTEFGWTNSQLATSYTITISLFCLGCIAGGFMMRGLGPKAPIIIGAVLVCSGFYLTSTLDGTSIVRLYLYYGVFAGFGIGMAYNTILAAVGAWFPDKKGFCSGVLMMGFGASTLVFGNLAASLINSPVFGWRKVFVALAFCSGIALLLNGLLISMPGPDAGLPQPKAKAQKKDKEFETVDMPTGKMITRLSFWMFFVSMMLLGAAGSSLISFARDFSISVGTAAAMAGIFVGALSIANGVGRIIAGMLFDNFGRQFVMIYVAVMEIAACAVCVLAAMMSSVPLCLIGFLLVGLGYGGNTNAVAIFTADFYGNKYYAQNLSFGLLTLLPSSFLAKLSTTLLNMSGGYVVPFVVLGVYGIVALVLNWINRRP